MWLSSSSFYPVGQFHFKVQKDKQTSDSYSVVEAF